MTRQASIGSSEGLGSKRWLHRQQSLDRLAFRGQVARIEDDFERPAATG